MDAILIAEVGPRLFGAVGGESTALASMKKKLGVKKKALELFDGIDEPRIRQVLDRKKIVAVRCRRSEAVAKWPSVAATCVKEAATSRHASSGSFVAMSGDVAWCFAGFRSQHDVQDAAALVVAEAKERAGDGRRDYFVCRKTPTFDSDEKLARIDHLFASFERRTELLIDEEAAYSVSNETSAAKVAKIAKDLKADVVIDATACVGGNTMGFAKVFSSVVAIELDPEKVKMLRHNLKISGHDLRVIHGDCLTEIPRLQFPSMIVFADPPWGGRNYKFQPEPDVHLKGSSSSLDALVDVCADHPSISHLLLKLPFNFDTESLVSRCVRATSYVYDLSKKVILLVLHFRRDTTTKKRKQTPTSKLMSSSGSGSGSGSGGGGKKKKRKERRQLRQQSSSSP